MENTKGLINYILSRKDGQSFLAACLLLIIFQWSIIVSQEYRINKVVREKQEAVEKWQQTFIDHLTKQNADYYEMQKQVDSMGLEVKKFKLKKEME